MKKIACNVQLGWYGPDNIKGPALFVIQAAPLEISGYTFAVHYQLDNSTMEWNRKKYVVTDPVSGMAAATAPTKMMAIYTATQRIENALKNGMMPKLLAESAHHARNLPVFIRPDSIGARRVWRAEHSMRQCFADLQTAAKKRRARNPTRETRA